MAKRKTKKQKMKASARQEEERLSYSLPEMEKGEKKAPLKTSPQIRVAASDRLEASYSSVIGETRYSIFVSIAIFIAYGLLYFLF